MLLYIVLDLTVLICFCLFSYLYGDHRDLHVLTHSVPTRRSSDLAAGVGAELPYTGTNSLASALSALFSGVTSTQKQSGGIGGILGGAGSIRSEEHTSELQSLMRSSYAVFCLKKKTQIKFTTPALT